MPGKNRILSVPLRDASKSRTVVRKDKTSLTVRVPRELAANARRYATQNNTTLSNLIEAHLRRLLVKGSLDDAPIVSRISGILSPAVDPQDHKKHVEAKYDQ